MGRVAAAGSSSAHRYQLRDAEAGYLNVALLYYRLRQVDVDGHEAFSPVVSVAVGKPGASAQLDVYPNPAPMAQAAHLDCRNLPAEGGQLLVYSAIGQLVFAAALPESSAHLALPALTDALYCVVLQDKAGHRLATQRLLVSNH